MLYAVRRRPVAMSRTRAVNQRAVQRVEVRQQRRNLGQERIGQNRGHFFFAAAARVADELAHVHLERIGQPFQRTQRGNGLAVLDLGDVGAGHLHAAGQLALAQMARAANLAHLSGHLQTGLGGSRDRAGYVTSWGAKGAGSSISRGLWHFLQRELLVLILHQPAVVAPHNFACFHAHKSGGHDLVAECQSGSPGCFLHRDRCYFRGNEP